MSNTPDRVYIGRKACGCCIAAAADLGDDGTARAVAEWINDKLTITSVDWDLYTETIVHEATFMNCPHGKVQPQPALF